MRVLPNPESRLGWKFVWAFIAVGVSLLVGSFGLNRTASILVGMACGYLLTSYLRNKAAEPMQAEKKDPHSLTALSLSTPTDKPENPAGKRGAT